MTKPRSLADFVLPERRARIETVASHRTRSIVLVLDRVRNAHNISAVMRSADAFGIQEIHLVGTDLNFTEEISMGSQRWLDLTLHADASSAREQLTVRGFEFVVLEAPSITANRNATSTPVFELPFDRKLALTFGNELSGVSSEFTDHASYFAHIPMLGFVESFNISVAAAITMFCSLLTNAEGKRRVAPLAAEELESLSESWFRTTIRGAESIEQRLKDERE